MTARPHERDADSHHQRDVAEGFGESAERYDRARPSYPHGLIERIVAASPGPDLLDVGCGTGIASRLFEQAGARVLGVDVDARMAAVAQAHGLYVVVAKFEAWDPAGRTFDAVVAAQTWHWIDPVAGAEKVAELLRPGGRVALFWNAADVPDGLRQSFSDVYRQVLPDMPLADHYGRAGSVADAYSAFLDKADDGLARAQAFDEPERWRYDWQRAYTRDEWLDQVLTQGGHQLIAPAQRTELLARLAHTIDAAGGGFTMSYATVVLTTQRR